VIYIVVCGLYEDAENACVTQDIDVAVTVALRHYNYKNRPDPVSPYWNTLNCIEVWDDCHRICEYGNYIYDKICTKQPLTHEELKVDLIKAIKKSEEKE
jgi:hypothetical protein